MSLIHFYGADEKHLSGYNLSGLDVRYGIRAVRLYYRFLRRQGVSRSLARSVVNGLLSTEVRYVAPKAVAA